MASNARQTTVTPSFMIPKFVIFVFMYTLTVHGVAGQCQLPDRMRGRWKEPLKGMLTFTNDSVSGYDIHTFGEFTLSCLLQNSSAFYIMESTPFSYFGLNFTAYTCWSFDEQSKDLVHLYEHTEENQQAGYERVMMLMPLTNWTVDSVCSNTNTSALTYRLLHKQRRKSGKGNKEGETGVVVAIIVLVVVASLVAIVSFLIIRRRKSRGMFKINAKTGFRNKASAYRVNEPENHSPSSSSSFKNTTTTTIAASGQDEPRRHPNITQVGKPSPEDNTSEDAYSPSSVSVTATSAFTSVSASPSSSASSSVFASGSGLMNQEGANPMTPICGSEDKEENKQCGFSDHFVPVRFSSSQGATADEGAVSASGTLDS